MNQPRCRNWKGSKKNGGEEISLCCQQLGKQQGGCQFLLPVFRGYPAHHVYHLYRQKNYTDLFQTPSSNRHFLKNVGIVFDLFLNILHDGAKRRRTPTMREDQMELDGLIQKVMDQMDKRRYGKKIITRYRSSFRLLISVSHDIGEDRLSERLM